MNFHKGDCVQVRDFKGNLHIKTVCSDLGDRVFVTSFDAYKDMEKNQSDVWPVGFPKADVFAVTSK